MQKGLTIVTNVNLIFVLNAHCQSNIYVILIINSIVYTCQLFTLNMMGNGVVMGVMLRKTQTWHIIVFRINLTFAVGV